MADPPIARRSHVLRRLLRRPPSVIAAGVVLLFVGLAVAAPHVAPFDPVATNFLAVRKPPSAVYRLGTDEVGRDVLSRLIWGARASLLAGVIPVSFAVVVSIPLGLFSGLVGGWIPGVDDLERFLRDRHVAVVALRRRHHPEPPVFVDERHPLSGEIDGSGGPPGRRRWRCTTALRQERSRRDERAGDERCHEQPGLHRFPFARL